MQRGEIRPVEGVKEARAMRATRVPQATRATRATGATGQRGNEGGEAQPSESAPASGSDTQTGETSDDSLIVPSGTGDTADGSSASGTGAGGNGSDPSTPDGGSDTHDGTSDADDAVAPCEHPEIMCDGYCIDPPSTEDYCGASEDCAGVDSGVHCATNQRCEAGNCIGIASGWTPARILSHDLDLTLADVMVDERGQGMVLARIDSFRELVVSRESENRWGAWADLAIHAEDVEQARWLRDGDALMIVGKNAAGNAIWARRYYPNSATVGPRQTWVEVADGAVGSWNVEAWDQGTAVIAFEVSGNDGSWREMRTRVRYGSTWQEVHTLGRREDTRPLHVHWRPNSRDASVPAAALYYEWTVSGAEPHHEIYRFLGASFTSIEPPIGWNGESETGVHGTGSMVALVWVPHEVPHEDAPEGTALLSRRPMDTQAWSGSEQVGGDTGITTIRRKPTISAVRDGSVQVMWVENGKHDDTDSALYRTRQSATASQWEPVLQLAEVEGRQNKDQSRTAGRIQMAASGHLLARWSMGNRPFGGGQFACVRAPWATTWELSEKLAWGHETPRGYGSGKASPATSWLPRIGAGRRPEPSRSRSIFPPRLRLEGKPTKPIRTKSRLQAYLSSLMQFSAAHERPL